MSYTGDHDTAYPYHNHNNFVTPYNPRYSNNSNFRSNEYPDYNPHVHFEERKSILRQSQNHDNYYDDPIYGSNTPHHNPRPQRGSRGGNGRGNNNGYKNNGGRGGKKPVNNQNQHDNSQQQLNNSNPKKQRQPRGGPTKSVSTPDLTSVGNSNSNSGATGSNLTRSRRLNKSLNNLSVYGVYNRSSSNRTLDGNAGDNRSREVAIVTRDNFKNIKNPNRTLSYYLNNTITTTTINEMFSRNNVTMRYNVKTGNVTSVKIGDHFYRIGARGVLIRVDSVRLDSQTIRTPFRLSSIPSTYIGSFKFVNEASKENTPAKPAAALTIYYQDYTKPRMLASNIVSDNIKTVNPVLIDLFSKIGQFFINNANFETLKSSNFYKFGDAGIEDAVPL